MFCLISLAELEGVVLPLPLQPGPVLVAEVRQAKAPLHCHERPHCSNHVAETRGEAQILDYLRAGSFYDWQWVFSSEN